MKNDILVFQSKKIKAKTSDPMSTLLEMKYKGNEKDK